MKWFVSNKTHSFVSTFFNYNTKKKYFFPMSTLFVDLKSILVNAVIFDFIFIIIIFANT